MRLAEFERRAREIFEEIPAAYREGVDGIVVEEEALPHPSLPDVYTLGECRSEFYPSEYGGPGEVRSFVFLYHGSFQRLAELSGEEWDWEGELWETVTHEVRHHLESLAAEDALEVQDYVEDQNFARRQGAEFDPFFYRSGTPLPEVGGYEVDGDVFLEREVRRGTEVVRLEWGGRELIVPLPEELGDVHYLALHGPDVRGEVVLVLTPRRGAWEVVRDALRGRAPRLLQGEVTLEDPEEE